jgi:RNA polymerase sigma factor for flagellar operon FliA
MKVHALGSTVAIAVSSQRSLTEDQERMVEENLPLVQHIVSRMTQRFPATFSRDDLVQAGALGLIEAVARFDPARGFAFSTFAGRRIEGAVLDALRSNDWASRSVRRSERQLRRVGDALTAELDREPTDRELSESMKIKLADLRNLKDDLARTRVETLHRRTASQVDGTDRTEIDVPANEEPQRLEERELFAYLRDAVEQLPERHRVVIVGYFLDGRTMTELGQLLGVTQSRASQLKSEALTMMRAGLVAALDDVNASDRGSQATYNEAVRDASTWRERVDYPAGR